MDRLLRDLRYGWRILRKNPLFSVVAITVIGLGLGANTAIFSVINGVLLNPLPYRDPQRVVMLWWDVSRIGGVPRGPVAPADFLDWKERSQSFEGLATFRNDSLTFTALDQPVTPLTHSVTANYFDVLGVQAFRGRTFVAGEDQSGHDRVAIISHGLWQSAFGGSDAVVGRNIELDGRSYLLAGVLPANFHSANLITVQPDLWVPLRLETLRQDRTTRTYGVVGRLRPGVSLAAAQAEMAAVGERIVRDNPATHAGFQAAVRGIREDLVGQFRPTFQLLLAAVGFVLLIACANVANLLLVRALARAKEMAVRSALGARRSEIFRQLLVESVLLAGLGALAGIALAAWSVKPLLRLIPDSAGMPFLATVGIDGGVAAVTLALSVVTGILFGLAPARQSLRVDLTEVLNDAGRSGMGGRSAGRLRAGLLVTEVALSFILLAGAGVVLRSAWKLAHIDPGFEPSNVLTIRNSLRGEAFATIASRRAHFQSAIRKLEAIPGVESVSAVSFPPPVTIFGGTRFVRPERPALPGQEPAAILYIAMPNYLEVMRIPLQAGRFFTEHDKEDSTPVAVVSRKLAALYFPGEDPLDKTIEFRAPASGRWKIVGVVGDQRFAGIDPEPRPVFFVPFAQRTPPIMNYVIRTSGDPMSIAAAAQKEIWSLGKLMNVYGVATMEQRLAESYWQSRFSSVLLAAFAGLALALTAAGLYGVISYTVSQRSHEIGIRMALGARPGEVLAMVVQQGMGLTLAGVVLGLLGSLVLNRLLAGLLYGVQATDPWTMAAVALTLATVAAVACINPARRASGIEPIRILRHL